MAEQSLSQLTSIINENGLKYVEHEGQIFFSSEEIGRQLGYAKPSKSINILINPSLRDLLIPLKKFSIVFSRLSKKVI